MTTTLSIYNMLRQDIVDRLTEQLETHVSDDSKVTVVSDGFIKKLPTKTSLKIEVTTGDEKWRHTINLSREDEGMKVGWIGEIGGGIFWRERFLVKLELYFPASFTQAECQTIAGVILSRARWSLQNMDNGSWWFTTDPDEFGEHASRVMVMDAYLMEGGSEGKWTHRGEIRLEFLTENDGCV